MKRIIFALCIITPAYAEDIVLPPQVTPAIRAACERDVRKHCIHPGATMMSVVSCVSNKFHLLNKKCKGLLTVAGLAP